LGVVSLLGFDFGSGRRNGNGPTPGLFSKRQKLCEHELVRCAGEFVHVGSSQVLGGNRVQD
jgi:hypothetical protein